MLAFLGAQDTGQRSLESAVRGDPHVQFALVFFVLVSRVKPFSVMFTRCIFMRFCFLFLPPANWLLA